MISPTVLNILHGTQDNPHGTHDIPTVMNTPHGTQDIPHIYHDIPHGTEHLPRYSRYSPTVLMISPTVLNIPHSTEHPHGTAHTLYRVNTCCGQHGELEVRKQVREKYLWKLSKHICCIHRRYI